MKLQSIASRLNLADLSSAVVTILNAKPDAKDWSFTNEKGEPMSGTSYTQKAKLEVGGFAYPFKVKLEQERDAWPEGEYALDLASMLTVNKEVMYLGKYHALVPLKAVKPMSAVG